LELGEAAQEIDPGVRAELEVEEDEIESVEIEAERLLVGGRRCDLDLVGAHFLEDVGEQLDVVGVVVHDEDVQAFPFQCGFLLGARRICEVVNSR
jgi:hypothetical protein